MTVTFELNLKSVLRWALGIVFLWAALSKLANLQDFYSSLVAYQLGLPPFLLRLVATTLPWLELFCALMLLSGFWLQTAVLWSLVLCASFFVVTGQAWLRGLHVSCGCLNLDFLGAHSPLVTWLESVAFACVRSLFLLAAAVYLWRSGSGPAKFTAPGTPHYA